MSFTFTRFVNPTNYRTKPPSNPIHYLRQPPPPATTISGNHHLRQPPSPATGTTTSADHHLTSDHFTMFLVQKATPPSPFRSTTTKPSHTPKTYQLAGKSFDEKVIHHLKTLDPPPESSNISLFWLSAALSFLSTVHSEAEVQISDLKHAADDLMALYMDYSLKVLDLCNLISSAVQRLTDRRILLNYSLRLLKFSDQMPVVDKLNKAKDVLIRSVDCTELPATEKRLRAKSLIEELVVLIDKLPRGYKSGGKDVVVRRTLYATGALTVFVGGILVGVLFGESDVGKLRVPVEFRWVDSVNGVWDRMFDRVKVKVKGDVILEFDEVVRKAVVVGEVVDAVVSGGDDDGVRVRLVAGVEEMADGVKRFSDGVDALTNGVNGLFRTVLKTRNGRLDM